MQKFILLTVLCLFWLMPQTALSEETAPPDYLVRAALLPYDERDLAVMPKFNFPPGTPLDYYVNGEKRQTDLPVIWENGRTLLPLRLVGEACGADVAWDSAAKQAVIRLNDRTVVVQPGSKKLWLNDAALDMAAAPELRGGVLYLPLREIGEALGKEVLYCGKLQQAFIMVYDKGRADYASRPAFCQLLEQTYLAGYGDVWDIGRQTVVALKYGQIYTDYAALAEQTFVGASWLSCAGQIEAALGCKLLQLSQPSEGAHYILACYYDGDALRDVRILWDGVPNCDISDDGFVYGGYWYATESWTEYRAGATPEYIDRCRFFRIDLNTPPDEFFTPEFLGVQNYHYGYAGYADQNPAGTPKYIVTADAVYSHGYRDTATHREDAASWLKIPLDGSGHTKVAAPPPAAEWSYQIP